MRTLFFVLVIFVLTVLYLICDAQAMDCYSFDTTNNNWQIGVSLNKEPIGTYHPADSVVVDDKKKEVIVLYPNEHRGVHYHSSDIREIKFQHHTGHHQLRTKP